jgi:hypothetical protein
LDLRLPDNDGGAQAAGDLAGRPYETFPEIELGWLDAQYLRERGAPCREHVLRLFGAEREDASSTAKPGIGA